MTTAQETMRMLADAFESAQRPSGESYIRLRDGSPEWMTDAVRSAHDGGHILPDDWIYDKASSIAENLADRDASEWDDAVHEEADSLVDVYNADRLKWLASDLNYAGVVDDAVDEFGHSDYGITGDIGIGQYHLLCAIGWALVQAARDQADA